MIKSSLNQLLLPEEFIMPFGGQLNPENRWVKLAKIIPWSEISGEYQKNFRGSKGKKPFNVRLALGALIIQTKNKTTDRETLLQIQENPYLQYFIGMREYDDKQPPFHHSMMTHFRKRLGEELINEINELTIGKASKKEVREKKDDDDEDNDKENDDKNGDGRSKNKGTLLLDATCAPSDIRYPTDLHLLNQSREYLEKLIDKYHEKAEKGEKKPRTYRQKARKDYLAIEKKRKKTKKAIRRGVKKQLGYVSRDLRTIGKYEASGTSTYQLTKKEEERLAVIKEVYGQQEYMYKNKTHQVENRIVSLSQSYVRPIVRGKAGKSVEFGSKVLSSVEEGYSRIEKISFENYNEGVYLQEAVENYYKRNGYYPEKVLADTIFRNRNNIGYLKEKGIKMSGAPLGRPPKDKKVLKEQKAEIKQDASKRIEIEGTYGVAKRRFGLNLIMQKTEQTSKTQISLEVFILNLEKILRDFLCQILKRLNYTLNWNFN